MPFSTTRASSLQPLDGPSYRLQRSLAVLIDYRVQARDYLRSCTSFNSGQAHFEGRFLSSLSSAFAAPAAARSLLAGGYVPQYSKVSIASPCYKGFR